MEGSTVIKHWQAPALSALALVGLLFGAFAPLDTQAQVAVKDRPAPVVGHSLFNDQSPDLRDMLAAPAAQPGFGQVAVQPRLTIPRASAPARAVLLAQTQAYPSAMPALLANFDGLSSLNGILPPDTNGDIGYDPSTGKKYYFQTVNMSFRFWDVSDPANPIAATPPAVNNTFWSGAGGLCETHNDGDPVALFDPLAHRWIFSQFALNLSSGPFYQCIAISATADPLGSWYRYSFQMPDGDMNDYPKLAVWPDAYYMSDHQFYHGGAWAGAGAFAFDRAKMLAGQPATYIYFNMKDIDINLGGQLPADFDGLNPPPVGAPGLFMELDHGLPADGDATLMRIWEFHADFSNPANSTFGSTTSGDWAHANYKLVVDPFNYLYGYVVPQKDTGQKLDAIGDRLMFRLAYRNFGDRQALVGSQTVDAGGGRAGMRWFEVQDSGAGWSIHQQGTYAPADGAYRWMGSIASDARGNLALGFSISSGSMFPSINVTGRLANDPPGMMAQGETTLFSGGGSQIYSDGRWGDYSAMSVDPQDDCTFWYTNEYYPVTSLTAWKTRIGAFRFSGCGLPATGVLSGAVTQASGGAPLAGATVRAGTLSMVTGADGKYAFALLPGSYTVSAQAYGFAPGSATGVLITVGGTTTRNFALAARSPATLHGLVSDGSGHGYALYARLELSAPGFSATVFSNPITGLYSANLFQGQAYALRVSSLGLAGYTTQTAAVTPAAASVALNVNLPVNVACTAQGYQVVNLVCTPIPGGLASGFVTDANDPALGLNGAFVSSDVGQNTNTFATPSDPSAGDGMYVIFQPTADNIHDEDHLLGADKFPYSSVIHTVSYHPNGVTRQDFALPAGRISVSPAALDVILAPGQSLTRYLRVTDTGTANAYFSLQTVPLPSPPNGPFDPPSYTVKPFKQNFRTAQSLHLPAAPETPPLDAGAVMTTWSSGLASAWAVGVDASGQVWVSSPAADWGGDSALHAYSAAGTATGQALPYAWQPFYGPADLASNGHSGSFWSMGMGEGDNCIYEMSPQAGFTGRSICPGGGYGFPVAQRGLAYDPASDTFYSGSWNDLSIRQFRSDGSLVRTRWVGLAISGLAYNPDTRHLFAMVNAGDTRIFVLDAANDFAALGVFTVGAEDPLGAFSGAGLEMACDGSLWLIDQSDGQVYQVTSGEATTMCQVQAAWFSVNPTNGYLAPGEYIDVQVTFNAAGLTPGDYTGQLIVGENTPYDVPNLPVVMHVKPGINLYLPVMLRSQ